MSDAPEFNSVTTRGVSIRRVSSRHKTRIKLKPMRMNRKLSNLSQIPNRKSTRFTHLKLTQYHGPVGTCRITRTKETPIESHKDSSTLSVRFAVASDESILLHWTISHPCHPSFGLKPEVDANLVSRLWGTRCI